MLQCARFRSGEKLLYGSRQHLPAEHTNQDFVQNLAYRGKERFQSIPGLPKRVGYAVKSTPHPDESSWIEWMKIQSLVIELAPGFRISGEKNLITAIKLETVNYIGTNAASKGIGRLQYQEQDIRFLKALFESKMK